MRSCATRLPPPPFPPRPPHTHTHTHVAVAPAAAPEPVCRRVCRRSPLAALSPFLFCRQKPAALPLRPGSGRKPQESVQTRERTRRAWLQARASLGASPGGPTGSGGGREAAAGERGPDQQGRVQMAARRRLGVLTASRRQLGSGRQAPGSGPRAAGACADPRKNAPSMAEDGSQRAPARAQARAGRRTAEAEGFTPCSKSWCECPACLFACE